MTASQQGTETYYGFEQIPEEERKTKVNEMFSYMSSVYDMSIDVMSLGIHRIWKNTFVNTLNPQPGMKVLDVAGGTGDIAFRIIQHSSKRTSSEQSSIVVTVCDINEQMLNVGRQRAEKQCDSEGRNRIYWLLDDAENLSIDSNSYDVYTVSFGMRNITDMKKALKEAYRVLKPGGRFLCLEFTYLPNPILRKLYNFYSFTFLPVVLQIFMGDYKHYEYLVNSIRKFPDQEHFKKLVQDAGFKDVTYENLTCGIVAIHSGYKR